jgi:hypothetical protein
MVVWFPSPEERPKPVDRALVRFLQKLRRSPHDCDLYGERKHKYRYYVCQHARQKGWKACQTKSVSAGVIEDSLVAELRARLSAEETRRTIQIPEADWQALLEGDSTRLVQSMEKIRCDGSTGLVSVIHSQ